jgi:hypothetical protein
MSGMGCYVLNILLAIVIAKYMEASVVKSVYMLLKDNLIRNLKKKTASKSEKK